MKCNMCNGVKGKRSCRIEGINQICSLCCGSNRNWNLCNTECSFFPEEIVNSTPIGNIELTRVYDGHTHMFIKDCFLPNVFDIIACDIENLTINIIELNVVNIKLDFSLKSQRALGNEVYLKDKWKIEENGIENNDKILVPLFQIYSRDTGESNANNLKYKIDNQHDINLITSSHHMNTWFPYSKMMMEEINVKNMPEFPKTNNIISRVGRGSFFIGKNDTYWGELLLNKTYSFNITVSYEKLDIVSSIKCINLPFGIMFPFPLINVHRKQIYFSKDINIDFNSRFELLLPINDKIEQLFLSPIEGNENTLAYSEKLSFPLKELEETFYYDRYSMMNFDLLLNANSGVNISSKFSGFPIPSGIYNTMIQLYEGKFAPVKVSITNTTDSIQKFKIVCKIHECSHECVKSIHLEPYTFSSFPISPLLIDEIIENLTEVKNKSITIKVYHENQLIHEDGTNITILPRETFIWEIKDYGDSWKVYLSQMLARWITPHHHEIDTIIAKASKIVGQIQGILSNNIHTILSEMKAIYDIISLDMRYVTRSFSFSPDTIGSSQRISLPSTTIKHKSGNCIDLSVLLASCFEACKIPTIIALIPGHAFVGVQLGENKIFIESTFLGSHSFEDAINQGMINYGDNFDQEGNPKSENSKLVHIPLSREHSILPME